MNLFVDTNAIVKLYHQEKGTKNFSKYLSNIKEELLINLSDVTKIEFHSALLKKFRANEIDINNLTEALFLFDKDFYKFNIVESNNIIKNTSIKLIDDLGLKFSLKTLDSIQLASALFINNYSKIDYFISADKKLLNIANIYFQVLDPEEL